MTERRYPVILLRRFVTGYKKRQETHYPEGSRQLAWQDRHGFIWLMSADRPNIAIATCSKPGVDFSWAERDPRTAEERARAREVPAAISYGEEATMDGSPRAAYRAFVERMLRIHRVSFHPDTPMTQYVYVMTGARVFAPAMAADLQAEHDALYGALEDGDDPYAIAVEVFEAFGKDRYP
jgi:hypothetical protein